MGAEVVDLASWQAAAEATRVGREQLRYLLTERDRAGQIATRFGNVGEAQRAGHVYEWQHSVLFNVDAVAKGAPFRLHVTEWLNRPHDPADLQLLGPRGEVLLDVQAKVVNRLGARYSDVVSDKYDGMQLLIPSDHLRDTVKYAIDRSSQFGSTPTGDRVRDATARVTDRVSYENVSSRPLTTTGITPGRFGAVEWLSDQIQSDQAHQLLTAAIHGAAGGAVAGIGTAMGLLAKDTVERGSVDGLPWAEAGIRGAMTAARSVAVAAAGQTISVAAQHGVASTGSAAWGALADGTLPFAAARSVVDVAVIATGVATGRLSPQEAALQTAQIVGRNTAVWGCGVAGQALIPVPVVGTLIGVAVGQLGTAIVVKGIQLAAAAREEAAEWDRDYDLLLQRSVELQNAALADLAEIESLTAEYRTAFSEDVLPRLHAVCEGLGTADPDRVLADLADLTELYAGTPLFSSMAEFNAFMADRESVLVLDLGT